MGLGHGHYVFWLAYIVVMDITIPTATARDRQNRDDPGTQSVHTLHNLYTTKYRQVHLHKELSNMHA